jgi:hypothetical protein
MKIEVSIRLVPIMLTSCVLNTSTTVGVRLDIPASAEYFPFSDRTDGCSSRP